MRRLAVKSDSGSQNRWLNCRDVPPGPRAVLAVLHRSAPCQEGLRHLTDTEWRDALRYCDRERLTMVLREEVREAIPHAVMRDIEERATKNAARTAQFEELYRELHGRLSDAGLEFVALKGLTQEAVSGRVQYDVDLYLPPETVHAGQNALMAAGFAPIPSMESFPTDHLPALLRRTDWKWRGDYFDPELPIAVELHFRFWSEDTECLRVKGVEAFWNRRVLRPVAGIQMAVLSAVDALAYAALHLLRHLFQGSVYAFHVYELARMLEARAGDESFWADWRAAHPAELRRLACVSFRLAREWFGCPAGAAEPLPQVVTAWFDEFALSPATQPFAPNKDQLWLQLALLDSNAQRWRVLRRRLAPGNLPPRAGVARSGLASYAIYSASRLRHHASSLPRTAVSGLRLWALRERGGDRGAR